MSIHDFQNWVQKNESSDLSKALREMSFLDSEEVGTIGWDPWY